MKTIRYILITIIILTGSGSLVNAQEVWLGTGTSFDLTNKVEFKFKVQSRFVVEDDFVNTGNLSQIRLRYRLSKGVRLGATYRYFSASQFFNENISMKEDKQRYSIDCDFEFPEDRYNGSIKNRLRVQNSIKDEGDEDIFVRNRLTYEMKFGKQTKFSISDEIFVEAEEMEFELNRVSFELQNRITKNVYLDTFFHLEKKIDSKKRKNTIFGAMLIFQF